MTISVSDWTLVAESGQEHGLHLRHVDGRRTVSLHGNLAANLLSAIYDADRITINGPLVRIHHTRSGLKATTCVRLVEARP